MGNLYKVNESLFYAKNKYVDLNPFLTMTPEDRPLPIYEEIKDRLPQPVWEGHSDVIACYHKTWEIAFRNLRRPNAEAGFVSNFIDTAFNGYLFMWDSSFIVMFGRYANHIFNFQKTLDNFYSHQHADGFICREICETQNGEQFHRDDPASTGPNIMPWSEWEYYQITGEKARLKKIFYPLLAYHKWLQLNRTWRDGSYWSTGLACGMDNQPRVQEGYSEHTSHGHAVWVDTCIHMVMSARILIEMGKIIGTEKDTDWLYEEAERLTKLINEKLWCEEDAFYYDLWRGDVLSRVKSIGAYWALLAGIVPEERLERFVAHLENPAEFNRFHRIPTLSADHPAYDAEGGYWRGSVWAPTNYMVLKGLEKVGKYRMAYEIAENHLRNVVEVFRNTGTVWENYAPEKAVPGNPAKSDFVGWTGLTPIAVLFEYVFGIRADSRKNQITWDVNRTERHGVQNYPFRGGTVDLLCEKRSAAEQEPQITVRSDIPVTVIVRWNGEEKTLHSMTEGKETV